MRRSPLSSLDQPILSGTLASAGTYLSFDNSRCETSPLLACSKLDRPLMLPPPSSGSPSPPLHSVSSGQRRPYPRHTTASPASSLDGNSGSQNEGALHRSEHGAGGVGHHGQDGGSGGGASASTDGSASAPSSDSRGRDGGGVSLFSSSPTSLSELILVFAHAVSLQSWSSWLLAVAFHLFHILLIISIVLSPILLRSVVFSAQTMEKSLLEAQGVIKAKRDRGSPLTSADPSSSSQGASTAAASGRLQPARVSGAPVSIESIWAIHDSLFFLEEGHAVTRTTLSNSFASISRRRQHRTDSRGSNKESAIAGHAPDTTAANGDSDDEIDAPTTGNDSGEGRTHTYVVQNHLHGKAGNNSGKDGGGGVARGRAAGVRKLLEEPSFIGHREGVDAEAGDAQYHHTNARSSASAGPVSAINRAARTDTGTVLHVFAAPPPIVPKGTFAQRKRVTHGNVTLFKMIEGWEASPLYSSPLALMLFYYLYAVGCVVLLLTVTEGKLTGHFAVLRLGVSVAEIFWYIHHGAHAFVIHCWLLLLSHWPRGARWSARDETFLKHGTPYAVVTKQTGLVTMYWFYRASDELSTLSGGDGGAAARPNELLVHPMNLTYYLYEQVWYLQLLAKGVGFLYLGLVALCLVKDIHRALGALVGVRELMEPEGCVRCPLCGELMEENAPRHLLWGGAVDRDARHRASWSMRRVRLWRRRLCSVLLGGYYDHRVPIPRHASPLWRWMLPEYFGGVPAPAPNAAGTFSELRLTVAKSGGEDFARTFDGSGALSTPASMAEEAMEFYEQSTLRRSAAAPHSTLTDGTAFLMRPFSTMRGFERRHEMQALGGLWDCDRLTEDSSSAEDGDTVGLAVSVLGLELSASSSSDEPMATGLVKAVPAPARRGSVGADVARRRRPARRASHLPPEQVNNSSSSPSRAPRTESHSHRRGHHHPLGRSSASQNEGKMSFSPQPRMHRSRFDEEVLYWNYVTRHVHHRCPKLYLNAQEATDDEDKEENEVSDASASSDEGSFTFVSSLTASPVPASELAPNGTTYQHVMEGAAPSKDATAGPVGAAAHADNRHSISPRGPRRSLSPRAAALRSGGGAAAEAGRVAPFVARVAGGSSALERPLLQVPDQPTAHPADTSTVQRHYGTLGSNLSETPAQFFAPPATATGTSHLVRRTVYDATKDGEDEFRPGNAFPSYDRAGWFSRVTFSWLDPLLTFGLLEPTLLRQERFLPSLPEKLLSLENFAIPVWRMWVHRKVWFANYVAKPGELLIPSNEALDRAEEEAMMLADLREIDIDDDDRDESASSEDRQTVVMLGHTFMKQVAKLRPQRPRRSWEERLLWTLCTPLRWVLGRLFYCTYIGTSRTVRRTRRRLVRELLKDRLALAAADICNANGYQDLEESEALEKATWALAEEATSCGSSCSSAAAPSAGSAVPTHMRHQLALSDVSIYHLFLEHRCGRRFMLVAAPLLFLCEILLVALVPTFGIFMELLQRASFATSSSLHEVPADQKAVTRALIGAGLIGVLLLLQGGVRQTYVSEVQRAAMEARTCVRAMILEKTLALPLAQRTFGEDEVVNLATEEASRVATCLVSLHHTWSCPLRVLLLSLLLAYYMGLVAATVMGLGAVVIVLLLRRAAYRARKFQQKSRRAAIPRLTLLQQALRHIREVKGMLMEVQLVRRLQRVRAVEAMSAEGVAMAESTVGLIASSATCLLMVVALGAQYTLTPATSRTPLRDAVPLVSVLTIAVLLMGPVRELPNLFVLVARGFLSMKRIEAYLRQAPDEFVGTWIDLAMFMTLQQQLRVDHPTSELLQYRRGSVICRNASFTWQHNLTEEAPLMLLREVSMRIEPGQLVIIQGSIGSGKSTLLLSILGEVNRCVSVAEHANNSTSDDADSSLSVISVSEAAAAFATTTASSHLRGAAVEKEWHDLTLAQGATSATAVQASLGGAAERVTDFFVASPTDSKGLARCTASTAALQLAGADLAAPHAKPHNAAGPHYCGATHTAADVSSLPSQPPTGRMERRSSGSVAAMDHSRTTSFSSAAAAAAHHLPPTGLDGDLSGSTGGFLVFGSCAYCAEVPWLQNDTIHANIVPSGRLPQMERWYQTVLKACALDEALASLPQGDATVVGERGESLSLSVRCRIAIARAVYSKSHVYLMDSVLSPLEPRLQEHIIREVFHRLLRKKTVILVSNVGLRSLRPHRVFSVVDGGVVREDTHWYKTVPSLQARSDDEGEEDDSDRMNSSEITQSAVAASPSTCSSCSAERRTPHVAPAPPLFAEEFEEPREVDAAEGRPDTFEEDPEVDAAALLFDGDATFADRDPLSRSGDMADRLGGGGCDAGAMTLGRTLTSASPNSRRSVHLSRTAPSRLNEGCSGSTTTSATPNHSVLTPAAPQGELGGIKSSLTSENTEVVPGPMRLPFPAVSCGEPSAPEVARSVFGDRDKPERGSNGSCRASAHGNGSSGSCSTGEYMRNHYAQQLERERILRHRHHVALLIFLRFLGGQVLWLLLTALLQQGVLLGVYGWTAVWLSAVDLQRRSTADKKKEVARIALPPSSVSQQPHPWTAVSDSVFLSVVCALAVLSMLLTVVRSRAVFVGLHGTIRFLYDQIVRRLLHAPASYFDSRIVALITRVLRDDAEIAEHHLPPTVETVLSCSAQVLLVALWNILVNPLFTLFLPMAMSLVYHVEKRHAVALREVRRLERSSVGGMTDILREVYQGAPTLRSMSLQDRLREEYCRALDAVNTASMVAYLCDRWVELRLHVLATLAVCTTATIGILFTFSDSQPSFTVVAMVTCLRVGPVLVQLCRSVSTLAVTEWFSVQRLMSLWRVPQEPLTLVGKADLYTYSRAHRYTPGSSVQVVKGRDTSPFTTAESPNLSTDTRPTMLASPREADEAAQAAGRQWQRRLRDQERNEELPIPVSTEGDRGGAMLHGSLSVFDKSSFASFSSPVRLAPVLSSSRDCTVAHPLLELRNVSARYRATLPFVLRHAYLAVYPRERLGVVGHAGQGKGSLFNVLLRLLDVVEGDGVFVAGEDAALVPYPILRSWFGLIPQEPVLLSGTWRSALLLSYYPEHRLLLSGGSDSEGESRPSWPVAQVTGQFTPTLPGRSALTAAATALPQTEASTQQSAVCAEEQRVLLPRGSPARPSPMGPAGCVNIAGFTSASDHGYGSMGNNRQAETDGRNPQQLRPTDSKEDSALVREWNSRAADADERGRAAALADAAGTERHPQDAPMPHRSHSDRNHPSNSSQRTPSGSPSAPFKGSRRWQRPRISRSPKGEKDRLDHPTGNTPRGISHRLVEDAALWEALRAVGLEAAAVFDGGLDAPLGCGDGGESGLTESQCRLLCLARAVLNESPVVLLEDTVHTGAGAQTDQIIQRVLANELRSSTVIIIAHRMSTVLRLCTRVVAVQDGVLLPIADMTPIAGLPTTSVTIDASGRGTGAANTSTSLAAAANVNPAILKQLSYYLE